MRREFLREDNQIEKLPAWVSNDAETLRYFGIDN